MLHLVAIVIPTYKRSASLLRLLRSIEKLETSINYIVIVAENDCFLQQSLKMVNKVKKALSFQIEAILVEDKNISLVRNVLLSIAFERYNCDFVAMIDDDEIVSPQWLTAFSECQIKTKADVIQGNTQPVFIRKERKWMKKVSFYHRDLLVLNSKSISVSTCNVFISKHVYESMKNNLFDLSFGITGGEDTEFFHRAKKIGNVCHYCPNALAYEYYDESRANIFWVLRRSFRVGRTNYRIFNKNDLKKVLSTVFILPFTIVRFFLFFWHANLSIHYLLKLSRQLGLIFEGVQSWGRTKL
ncbi:glycosyltransferase family 2 protein [Brenneria tiliae]|uniref:Glycosyltransferase n=1 Tax=Brenneria tiliae TaxID=2914984 RepID=A0ABT0MN14_9GAMM|nr:glycosyltransferase family 2 protein [Brenneria tiliae]MCL2891230.1 glycosyltransferase [Brenneria tiliae]